MTDVTEVHFGRKPDFLGLHAFSSLLYCGLHPKFTEHAEKNFLFTLDYTPVKSEEATGQTSPEQMDALSERLGVKPGSKLY